MRHLVNLLMFRSPWRRTARLAERWHAQTAGLRWRESENI